MPPECHRSITVSHRNGVSTAVSQRQGAVYSTSPNIDTGTVVSMRIHELSTRSAHPRAQESVITVPTVAFALDFEMDICGPKVSILITLPTTTSIPLPHFCRQTSYYWPTSQEHLNCGPQDQSEDTGPEIGDGCQYQIQRVDNNPKDDTTRASQPLHSSFADSLVALSIVRIEQDGLEVQTMCLTILRRGLLQQLPSTENRDEEPTIICGPPHRSARLQSIHTEENSSSKQNQNDRNAEPTTGQFVFMPPSELDSVDEGFGEQAHSRLGAINFECGYPHGHPVVYCSLTCSLHRSHDSGSQWDGGGICQDSPAGRRRPCIIRGNQKALYDTSGFPDGSWALDLGQRGGVGAPLVPAPNLPAAAGRFNWRAQIGEVNGRPGFRHQRESQIYCMQFVGCPMDYIAPKCEDTSQLDS
ncbi:hypothetical protein DFH08DRAFT_807531 [Mycena albidolilacea]|uniref:Uncharacterized protein n=1 Tax=Mycena albidolilacea TaxID=1033008 RepID=A0AAD7ES64_9AGAR|nr:hypothetical protein DFH08DRAFT_807531 [Mycena albidolilacea]